MLSGIIAVRNCMLSSLTALRLFMQHVMITPIIINYLPTGIHQGRLISHMHDTTSFNDTQVYEQTT